MKSSVEKLSDTRSKITVEVPFSELKPEIDQAYAALAQQVQIPGFRKGKAPRQLIDARFGRGPVLEQVVNDMLPNRYAEAVEAEGIKAIGQPEVEVTKIEDGELVEFTAEVDVRPEFELPKFEDISVEVPAIKADEAAVDAELDNLRARFSTLKDHNHKLKKGEFVTINITATVNGEKVEEATTEGLSYEIGSDDLIDGLDKALIGAKKDDTVEFTSELVNGEHKGEEALISVEITATKQRELPELDDEFAQLASEFDTIEELRESTVTDVEAKQKSEQAANIRDEVLKAALAEADFALPQSIVDEQVHSQLHQLLGQLAHDDAALNSFLESQGTTREEFDKQNREDAEKAVRTQLFLDTLAEVEEPEVSQQELTDHILFTAQSYGMDPNQFIGQLQQSGQIANLFADVRRGKALAQAICRVNVKDSEGNEIDPQQYFGEEEVEETESE
ncbi:Trigger factor [Corynebacterium deserti GIMN1.010]|uniref:Trigger factor n=1 Tax=Corynebacterium deserti GIMN1.010 TaxID=931089 RepID=A0A0M4CJL5_9CORY|nr:trigger factor [Corynebacterium deserti]ALC06571.1 Trigger factor [Corynebacterium deserti GIMN1.010]